MNYKIDKSNFLDYYPFKILIFNILFLTFKILTWYIPSKCIK